MSIRVLRVPLDHGAEVVHSILVQLRELIFGLAFCNHLVSLGAFMDVPDVCWDSFDAAAERPHRFLELLCFAIG